MTHETPPQPEPPEDRAYNRGWLDGNAAGLDAWNLFYIGMVKLESPLYARLALAGIHDADNLGTRVMLEVIGAVSGSVLGWWLFSHRHAAQDADRWTLSATVAGSSCAGGEVEFASGS